MNDVNKLRLSKKDASKVINVMEEFDKVLGVINFEVKEETSDEIKRLIDEREEARKKKDWEKADKIRAELKKKGIALMDTPEGPRWKKV